MTIIPEPTHSFYQIYFLPDRYSKAHTQLLSNLFPPWQVFQRPHTASVKSISYMTDIPEQTHSFCQIYFLHDRYSRTHTQLLSIFAFYMTDIPEPTHSFYQINFHHDRYFRAHTQPLSNLFPRWQIFQCPNTASVKFISTMTDIPKPKHSFGQIYFQHDSYSRAHT